jgi:phage terminase Nu1 subunit (DNA packaging protein)
MTEKLPRTVSAADLAALLGKSPNELRSYLRRGAIVRAKCGRGYDLAASIRAFVAHLENRADKLVLNDERARLAKEQADAQAYKNEQLRKVLLDAGDVERRWFEICRRVRAGLLAIPGRLIGLDRETTADVDRHIRDVLTEMGEGKANAR